MKSLLAVLLLSLALLTILPEQTTAATVWFNIRVVDASSGRPIVGARVHVDGGFLGATNSNGDIRAFVNYLPATHSYSASAKSCKTKGGSVKIGSKSGGGDHCQVDVLRVRFNVTTINGVPFFNDEVSARSGPNGQRA